jgi:hypothetical protein
LASAGQSLGDLSRQEAQRRKGAAAGKVYTNKDLKDVPAPDVAGPAPVPNQTTDDKAKPDDKSTSDAKTATEPKSEKSDGTQGAKSVQKDQSYWQDRARTAHTALERDQVYADALQTRVSSLTTDFVNRDDPAQRAVIAIERDKAVSELDRLKKTIAQDKQAIADLEEEARKAGVPPGWLR